MQLKIIILGLIFPIGFIICSHAPIKNSNINGVLLTPKSNSDTSRSSILIKIDSFNLPIIPPSSGVRFYKNGIIFLSSTKNEGNTLEKHTSFGRIDTYYAILSDSAEGEHTIFSPSIAFPFPSDAISFANPTTIYLTKYSKKEKKQKIFKAEYGLDNKTTGWNCEANPVNFCSENANYSHPAISIQGESIVFASDKPGSIGGMDLFVSHMENNKWSEPKNLGNWINTKGNEFYPFLDTDNNLFFSSDGLPGMGGFDIFMCKYNGEDWGLPVHLTRPVNSEYDDVAFSLSPKDGKTAFFSTKQNSSKQEIQLYKLYINPINLSNENGLSALLLNLSLLESDTKPAKTEALSLNTPVTKIVPEENPAINTKVTTENTAITKVNPAKAEPIAHATVKTDTPPLLAKENPTPDPTKPVSVTPEISKSKPASNPQLPSENKDVVIYRIQFASNTSAKGSYTVKIGSDNFQTFEYQYKGAFRSTVGELKTLSEASAFQSKCRSSGFPQAFVVVFINGERSLDPRYFK